jgi:hypothetical protein
VNDQTEFFRVTHPFHPLYGHEFRLVERRTAWGEDRVYFLDETGKLRRLPAAWTSAAVADVFTIKSAGRSHFRVADLLQLVELIARQVEARRSARGGARTRKVSRK